jgi:molybdopterin molybdotransferase
MIAVEEALQIVLSKTITFPKEELPITSLQGRTLAEAIIADRDLPPYHRVAMDGIAIAFESFKIGRREFSITGVQRAGEPAQQLHNANACLEAMTGAVLPIGTDTVVRYEDLKIENGIATILLKDLVKGSNVHAQGSDKKANDVLIHPGTKLSAAEIAVLASVGKSYAKAYASPKIAIISTGDELVDIDNKPLPHQIRKSNSYALLAALQKENLTASQHHFNDNEAQLKAAFEKLIHAYDVLIISGGVSKGKFDFIPKTLAANGIEKHFHGVAQKPGKPFWFGTGKGKVVFALPGNPVSTYLCFFKYILPWIYACRGVVLQSSFAQLAEDFQSKDKSLTYFLQVRIENHQVVWKAFPVLGGGSGDHANLLAVDGFLELSGNSTCKAGTSYPLLLFR